MLDGQYPVMVILLMRLKTIVMVHMMYLLTDKFKMDLKIDQRVGTTENEEMLGDEMRLLFILFAIIITNCQIFKY